MAQTMASIRMEGSDSKRSIEMTLVRIVSVTRDPTSMAPANSITEAMHMACLRVSEREATEVANELATSLAPIQACQSSSYPEAQERKAMLKKRRTKSAYQYSTHQGMQRGYQWRRDSRIAEEQAS